MSKVFRSFLLLAVFAFLFSAQPVAAQSGINGHLVTVQWLHNNLNTGILLLDASPAPRYAAKHIPGAAGVSMMVVNTPFALQQVPLAEVEKMYRAAGISKGKRIVIYDQGAANDATRLFFSLSYHGFPTADLFILDGGLAKWEAEKLPTTSESTPATPNDSFRIEHVNDSIRALRPEVLTASGDPANNVLLDALDASWHFGQFSPFNRPGHLPNAVLLPAADFYHADKTFKSAEEITRMLGYLGIRRDQQIYTYCGGGIAASVPFFAIKFIANYDKVKLYTGSALDWVADPRDLPLWTYDAPALMRDSKWLQFWGGDILRMYLGPQVSIIDLRPAAEYRQGHVPFALNISADVFRSNFDQPEKLAEILGPAGVSSSYEAVLISGAGLTSDSALAFLMLEKLGQKRVSVMMDSTDQWAKLGFKLTPDPTVVGPKKAPGDVTVVPSTYSPNFRPGVIVADANSTGAAYPKVFLASGKNLPTKAPQGKVVHVPYTDLLNADGTPKPAKEIWTVLNKAGVPRYAELVCISDDLGEAAANYFLLKLMGFPDVKVLRL